MQGEQGEKIQSKIQNLKSKIRRGQGSGERKRGRGEESYLLPTTYHSLA
jgi:hypothetical protein